MDDETEPEPKVDLSGLSRLYEYLLGVDGKYPSSLPRDMATDFYLLPTDFDLPFGLWTLVDMTYMDI